MLHGSTQNDSPVVWQTNKSGIRTTPDHIGHLHPRIRVAPIMLRRLHYGIERISSHRTAAEHQRANRVQGYHMTPLSASRVGRIPFEAAYRVEANRLFGIMAEKHLPRRQ